MILSAFHLGFPLSGITMVKQDQGHAQQNPQKQQEEPRGYFNLRTKTLGGMQFWTDVRSVQNWRIQRNVKTGHHRLLDPTNLRHAWGNRPHCDLKMNELITAGTVKPHRGKVVIVLHGMIRTRNSMQALTAHLSRSGEYEVINFQYASTREKVAKHSADLKQLVDSLGEEVTEINFVGHSLGNIVVRHYLGLNQSAADKRIATVQGDKRIKRIVMIGPPNQGSKLARTLNNSALYKAIAGASGTQLSDAKQWEQLKPELATPQVEFGIIAGGQDEGAMTNFVLNGKDDFTVAVEETKLPGASDFLVHPLLHGTMMHQEVTLDATLNFFRHGYFNTKETKNPLPREEKGNPQR